MYLISCICPITVNQVEVGGDILFTVTGGLAHIGAVAVAYKDQNEVMVTTTELAGHKEGPLAAELARYAAQQLQRTVTVVMGIHKDQATKEEIADIVGSLRKEWETIIEKSIS